MFTTVFVGNSQTRRIGDYMVTPRGTVMDSAVERLRPVLLFGGTTEGRELAAAWRAEGSGRSSAWPRTMAGRCWNRSF